MGKGRLEAFSDGVLAIIITIMVLALPTPHEASPAALYALSHKFLCYVLSFVMVGIYWNNHHHLLSAVKRPTGRIMWANTHLLFWLTLIPFATSWMGENHFGKWTVSFYGFIMAMAGIAYFILSKSIVRHHGEESALAREIGRDIKGKLSVLAYAVGMAAAFYIPIGSAVLYSLIAIMWFIPDKRIEKAIEAE